MNEEAASASENSPRAKVNAPFFRIGNEVFDVVLPLMGADCFAVYAYFKRVEYRNPKLRHSVREMAGATDLGTTTVSRVLEILEHFGLLSLSRFGGSNPSECQLADSMAVANRLGVIYNPRSLSYSLPPEAAQRVKAEVKAIRARQQAKHPPDTTSAAPNGCGNRQSRVSQRNASVYPERRQRSTRETQTGTHLLEEEGRDREVPSPTPSHSSEAHKDKDSPDEDEPDPLLKGARVSFTGVMNEMGDHLLDTNKPQVSHLSNGFGDWKQFGFDSLAVDSAEWRGAVLALVLSVTDPLAAEHGLYKYRKTWESSLRKWYGCEVCVELRQAKRKL